MEDTKFAALHSQWYAPPPEEIERSRTEPLSDAARTIQQQEGAAFGAFMAVHSQVGETVRGRG